MQTKIRFPGLWEIGFANRIAKSRFCANAAQNLHQLHGLYIQAKVHTKQTRSVSNDGSSKSGFDPNTVSDLDPNVSVPVESRWHKHELVTKETTGIILY